MCKVTEEARPTKLKGKEYVVKLVADWNETLKRHIPKL